MKGRGRHSGQELGGRGSQHGYGPSQSYQYRDSDNGQDYNNGRGAPPTDNMVSGCANPFPAPHDTVVHDMSANGTSGPGSGRFNGSPYNTYAEFEAAAYGSRKHWAGVVLALLTSDEDALFESALASLVQN